MTFLFIRIFLSLLILSVLGCSFNLKLPPQVKLKLPNQYIEASKRNKSPTHLISLGHSWWQIFKDPKLIQLINLLFQQNYDLKQAAYNLKILQKQADLNTSSLYPQLNLQANTGKQGQYLSETVETTPTSMFLLTSYELDFFQKIKSQNQAHLEAILANKYQLKVLEQSLVSSVVHLYLSLSFLDQQIKTNSRILTLQQQITSLTSHRYQKGLSSYSELLAAQNQELQLKNNLLVLKQKRKDLNYQLCLLLGQYPHPIVPTSWSHFARIKPSIKPGLPSKLLKNRPDVLAIDKKLKELALKAKVARRERFPQIKLTSQLGYTSSELESLFEPTSFLYNLAFNLTAPIFDASRLKTKEELAILEYTKTEQVYAKTVLSAFKEVETSLSKAQELELASINLQKTLKWTQQKLNILVFQYIQGQVPYNLVLSQKKALLQTRLSLEQNHLDYLIAQVNLIKALGGADIKLIFK